MMTKTQIIVYSLMGIGIIIFIIIRRIRAKKQKQREAQRSIWKEQHEKLNLECNNFNTRFYTIKKELKKENTRIFERAESLLRTYWSKKRVFYSQESIYEKENILSRITKEMKSIESLYTQHQRKLLDEQSLRNEVDVAIKVLEVQLNSFDRKYLDEKHNNIICSIKNRLSTDINKAEIEPRRALRRMKSSMKRLDEIMLCKVN